MIKPIRRLISAGIVLAFSGLLILAATQINGIFFSFYPKFSRSVIGALAGVTSVLPFAVWELAVCALVVWLIVSFILSIVHKHILRWVTGVALFVSVGFCFFLCVWGLNYFAPSMSERLELQQEQYTPEQLQEVTRYYMQMANATAQAVQRDIGGVMVAGDFSDLSKAAGEGFEALAQTMDCFDGSTAGVKKLLSSKLFGKTGTTGIFIAFTGESCVSSVTFSASMPFTMCHEIGHRMAFARENEANFAAFLACSNSTQPEFLYSGYYSAFIYCYNALYRVDPDAAVAVWSEASAELKADCAAAREHNQAMRDEGLSEVTDKVYDTYLKAFSVDSGQQSYGEVVDLLAAWYFCELS